MSLYLTQLAAMGGPSLEWIQARVSAYTGGNVTLSYLDGEIPFASCLDSYTPVVGDYVHCLSLEGQGVLILGTSKTVGATPAPIVPQAPVIFSPSDTATWDSTLGTWTTGTLIQSLTQTGCWFYAPNTFVGLAATQIQFAELEVIRTSGGPLELDGHLNVSAAGPLVLSPEPSVLPIDPTAGVATWVPIPLGWASDLVNGTIKGFAIPANYEQSGIYTGGGRVRLTPLSVTM